MFPPALPKGLLLMFLAGLGSSLWLQGLPLLLLPDITSQSITLLAPLYSKGAKGTFTCSGRLKRSHSKNEKNLKCRNIFPLSVGKKMSQENI
jgi:hypothetical protein